VEPRRRQSTTAPERHRPLLAVRSLEHELECRDAKVVVGSRLDDDFFQRRHVLVARRTQNTHVRRPIVHCSDEVLGVACVLESVLIRQGDPVRTVLVDHQRAIECLSRARQRHFAAVVEDQESARDRFVCRDRQPDLRTRRAVDVATILVCARLEADTCRELIMQIDARNPRRANSTDVVIVRPGARGGHVIAKRGRDLLNRDRKDTVLTGRLHSQRPGFFTDNHLELRHDLVGEPVDARGDGQRRSRAHFRGAR
jgi:hypothetical protein